MNPGERLKVSNSWTTEDSEGRGIRTVMILGDGEVLVILVNTRRRTIQHPGIDARKEFFVRPRGMSRGYGEMIIRKSPIVRQTCRMS
jgi:hypothetical protein